MSRAANKAERLTQIVALLLRHPEGLTQSEIARRVHVDRSTVYRYLPDLTSRFAVTEKNGRMYIDKAHFLVDVQLTLHEATALHLATRLLTTRTDRKNPHSSSALRKLSVALENLAPHISQHMSNSAEQIESSAKREDNQHIKHLEMLTLAWSNQQKVKIDHKFEGGDKQYSYIFSPYFIEPYAVGQTTHIVGFREPLGEIRTFKLERITKISVLNESYDIPKELDLNALLKNAWSIWYTESEPVCVKLLFSQVVTARVQESLWHPSQSIEQQEDGSLLWTAYIAEPKEMLPWIRGWGADCEVLAPEQLRMDVAQEALRLCHLYLSSDGDSSTNQQLPPPPPPQVKDEPPYAHTPNYKGRWHSFKSHANAVATIASEFAAPFGASKAAFLLGWWHDAGKLYSEWQKYLLSSHKGSWPKGKRGPEHSIVGCLALMQEAELQEHNPLYYLAACIASHHKGLGNWKEEFSSWKQRAKEPALQAALVEARAFLDEQAPITSLEWTGPFDRKSIGSKENMPIFSMAWRMLHSCLIDADCLDTEAHFSPSNANLRAQKTTLQELWDKLQAAQQQLMEDTTGTLNRHRKQMYEDAVRAAELTPGFFSLTIPTGGGKTRTGMAFALRHAIQHKKSRVIVAIPYTSIIEQNADVFKNIFGEEHVLEHHSARFAKSSTQDLDSPKHEQAERQRRLLAQNWDVPVVMTTNVQFFESLFASKNSRLRKLHNIANSVIILDEIQTLPPGLLAPTLRALDSLVKHFGCSIVFCTATQPAFSEEILVPKKHHQKGLKPLEDLREIVHEPERHFEALQRVDYVYLEEILTVDTLVERMMAYPQALIVMNTVDDAHKVSRALKEQDDEGLLHLSTRLCGAHRRERLKEVKERLSNGQTCRLISTQVVEAGVDIDFPVVFRVMAPLDSIIQAAGRCNREGKHKRGEVYIFELEGAKLPPGTYKLATNKTKNILTKKAYPLHDPHSSKQYFRELYAVRETDEKNVLQAECSLAFSDASARYRLIEDATISVLIWRDEDETIIKEILQDAKHTGFMGKHMRALQPYLVSIREPLFEKAQQEGWLQPALPEQDDLFEWIGKYDPILGLIPEYNTSTLLFP